LEDLDKCRDLLSHYFFKSILPSTSSLHNLLPPPRDLNEVEAVQHVYLTNIPVWFGLLGDV